MLRVKHCENAMKPSNSGAAGRVGRPRALSDNPEEPAREAILKAAGRLFRRQGFAATSTRQIAEAAGLRQPTIFHYFKNKLAIMETIAEQAVAPELEFIDAEARREQPADEALYRYVFFVVHNLSTNPNVIGSPLQFPELSAENFSAFWQSYERIYDTLGNHLRAGMQAGIFIDLPLALSARQVFALVEAGLEDEPLDDAAARLAAANAACLVLRGLLVDQSRLDQLIAECEPSPA